MEGSKEHIATLCALSTVGVAATGLAFGMINNNDIITSPTTFRKRKAPGSAPFDDSCVATRPTPINKRIVSEPAVLQPKLDYSSPITFRTLLSRSIKRKSVFLNDEKNADGVSPSTNSRESSLNRRNSILRPWSARSRSTTPSTIDTKEPPASSSWLKRMSVLSISHDRSPSPSVPDPVDGVRANKLVKRASSQRILLDATAPSLRRPATSHQRSVTLSELSKQSTPSVGSPLNNGVEYNRRPAPTYRPFFNRGYPRKRYATEGAYQSTGVRTISATWKDTPALVLGPSVHAVAEADDQDDDRYKDSSLQYDGDRKHRTRRSIGPTRRFPARRIFSEPAPSANVHSRSERATSNLDRSPISPLSYSSTFDIVLPQHTPSFRSSSPYAPNQHVFSRNKRDSVPSMPTTLSSDNDTRIFTDDDSMDFQSDTAYDSLATRATASSHSGLKPSNIETIFHERAASTSKEIDVTSLEDLMQNSHLVDGGDKLRQLPHDTVDSVGMGIEIRDNEMDHDAGTIRKQSSTPSRPASLDTEAFTATPTPARTHYTGIDLASSPPGVPGANWKLRDYHKEAVHPLGDAMDVDAQDAIDWSPKSEALENLHTDAEFTNSSLHVTWPTFEDNNAVARHSMLGDKRSSIFDWSETLQANGVSDGPSPRPKTVHGKQGSEDPRSRSAGRRNASALHLRSQSVPVHRDGTVDTEPFPTAKFGTWGLGNKPVSEEWGDDFDFDDQDESLEALPAPVTAEAQPVILQRGSVRSVKIPQTIIDRQASVHLQFGQVQEFMLLVEELKRLRAQGARLHLLENHSKQLWLDAEAIINLATINEEEDEMPAPASPTSSDIFGDETPPSNRASRDIPRKSSESRRDSIHRRSISSPAPPSQVRARGESMAQAKSFLETIHQNRRRVETLAEQSPVQPHRKLPFDTQDLRDLVVRAGVINRALKDLVRKAEGVSVSPEKTPRKSKDPAFSEIFNTPHSSPTPTFKTARLPQSRSANSFLDPSADENDHVDLPTHFKLATMV